MTKQGVEKVTDEVVSMASSIWLAGLGALATAQDEGSKVFTRLVQKGKGVDLVDEEEVEEQVGKARTEVRRQVSKAKDAVSGAWGDLTSTFDDQLGAAMHRLGVPTRDEIKTLTERVEALTEKVDQLRDATAPAPKPRTRRAAPKKAASTSRAKKATTAKAKPAASKAKATAAKAKVEASAEAGA